MSFDKLDHIVILCDDIDTGTSTYETLLGRRITWAHDSADEGTATALIQLGNVAVELIAPKGAGPVGDRIRQRLEAGEPALASMAFGTSDIFASHYDCMRKGLRPEDITETQASFGGQVRSWSSFRMSDEVTGGLKVFAIARAEGPLTPSSVTGIPVTGLDHIVVNTVNPDRVMATFGARLGVRLALDRTNTKWGARFLFFRLPDTTIEVVQRLDEETDPAKPDSLWGVTWEVEDLHPTRDRLIAAGLDVSDIREGRKPGTQVMTVRNGTLNVPTLFLSKG